MAIRENTDNKYLRSFFEKAKGENQYVDTMTSIRNGSMYVEMYINKELIYRVKRQLPDEFDDVALEKELYEELIVKIIKQAIDEKTAIKEG